MSRLDLNELRRRPDAELMATATSAGVQNAQAMSRPQLLQETLRVHSQSRGTLRAEGVLEVLPDGFGFLRDPEADFLPGPEDIYVSPSQIRRFRLRTGDLVAGVVRSPKDNERYLALIKVESLNAGDPEDRERRAFDQLTPVHPQRAFELSHPDGSAAAELMDLFCPLGFGQRGLILAPPRAGRTTLLRDIAAALEAQHPQVQLLVLLIDERPEEVTEFRRAVHGQVLASTFDEPATRHVQVAEMVIERARRLVEGGQDVVILLDSLTRLVRAYNQTTASTNRPLSGGLDAGALHRPKRFFGAARNAEQGGSLTILATALVDTGTQMDQVILEEFKGTANLELTLNPDAAEQQLFPAIDLARSRTRRVERLIDADHLKMLQQARLTLRGGGLDIHERVLKLLGENTDPLSLLAALAVPPA